MRIFKAVLKYVACAYIAASLILSALVSLGVARPEIIRRRAPFLVVDVCASTIEGSDCAGHFYGYDQHGEYVGFSGTAEDYPEGLNVVSLMIYNPFTRYIDDIAARCDISALH